MATLISLRLPDNQLKPLDKLSASSERPRTYLIKKALENYLEEVKHYQAAMERLHDKGDEISLYRRSQEEAWCKRSVCV